HSWEFSHDGVSHSHTSHDLAYESLSSIDFYRYAMDRIGRSPNVDFLPGTRVSAVEDHRDYVLIHTNKGVIQSSSVVDTRPAVDDSPTLNQIFHGAEIQVDGDVFDPNTVGLMTDMSVDQDGFRFTYVLPYSNSRALIEETRFSPRKGHRDILKARLTRSINRLAQSRAFNIIRQEQGCLPMTAGTANVSETPNIVKAGASGGAIRGATGYAFARIQSWARLCAQSMVESNKPCPHPPDPVWLSKMDALFLRVIKNEPRLAPVLFMAMAQRVPPQVFVRFLSDECKVLDFFRVARSFPKTPFLSELIRVEKRAV
ncbi:MAG: lycopene cyclase family protein, partial [Pseudomonadota bacterium]